MSQQSFISSNPLNLDNKHLIFLIIILPFNKKLGSLIIKEKTFRMFEKKNGLKYCQAS